MSRPINLLLVINALPKQGPVNVLESLITGLDPSRVAPVILCLRGRDPGGHDRVFEELGVPIYYFEASLWALELMPKRIARRVEVLAHRLQADIVHAHGYHPDLVVSYLSSSLVRISTQHNISLEDFTYGKGQLLGRYMDARLWSRLPRLDALVGITEHVRRYCQGRCHKGSVRLETILNGIDTSCFRPASTQERAQERARLLPMLPPDAPYIIVCGSLSARKDPLLIIRAFVYLISVGAIARDTQLLFLGAGRLLQACQEASRVLESQIHFLGFRANASDFVRVSDLLVTASHSEGFGLNVAEALLSGIPVVGTDLPPYRELMLSEPDLTSGLYPVGDAEALGRKIVLGLSTSLSPVLVDRLGQHLSLERMADQYMTLYESCCEQR